MLIFNEQIRGRITDGIRKYSRIVAQARQRGMNDRDTSDIIKAMLGDMLGYDPFFDVTTEISVRGRADHAVLLEGKLEFLVVVKAIGIAPNAAHLVRLTGIHTPPYAEWVVLTNADTWACYRLGVGNDRHAELVFRAALGDPKTIEEQATLFFLLSKEGVEQDALSRYWERTRVLNPGRLTAMLLSDEVLGLLKRELMRTANFRTDQQTIMDLLLREVIRPDVALSHVQAINLPLLPQCYAYVPNQHDPTTWKLPYRNPDGTPNADALVLAAMQLGGDGRATGIPADDKAIVKQRLRQAYFELDVSPDELPPSLH